MAAGSAAHPVVGHPSAWGRASFGTRVQPYQLTPGATDTMRVRVREKIDILGVGTDVVEMEGIFTVRRDHPCGVEGDGVQWGRSCVKTEFRALELYGESPVFGTVRLHLDPAHASFGEVGPAAEGSLAADCVAHCFPTVELPGLGLRLTTGGTPIDLASKVIQIPPVGDVARSSNSANLVDASGKVVGEIVSSDIEVGEVLWSIPIGATRPGDEPEHTHQGHHHDQPSGSQFWATPETQTVPPPAHGHGGHGHDQGGHGGHGGHGGGGGHGGHGTQTPKPSAQQGTPQVGGGDLAARLDRLEADLRSVVAMVREMTTS